MKRTAPRPVLGFFFVGLAFIIFPTTTVGQACSFEATSQGRVCTKPGAKCSPPTVGGGDVGKCTVEGQRADALVCECQGAPTPSYNVTLSPLTPEQVDAGIATSTITVIPFNGYTGNVEFSCTISGMTEPAPTCATPAPATVSSGASATSALAVTISGSTAQGTYRATVSAVDTRGRPPDNGAQSSNVSVTRIHWTIGNSLRALSIAVLAFLLLLTFWGLAHRWRSKRAPSE